MSGATLTLQERASHAALRDALSDIGVTLTRQEALFFERVVLRLVDTGNAEPTPEDIAEAMQAVCDRDKEIFDRFLELEHRARPQHYAIGTRPGSGDEPPSTTLARSVYRRIRAEHPTTTT